MKELEDEIVEREVAFTDDWFMVRKMDRTPTFAEAINWADTHPNWIKVEDRLPEDEQMVLVMSMYYSHKYESWSWDIRCVMYITDFGMKVHERYVCREKITHWMPIFLPKEG